MNWIMIFTLLLMLVLSGFVATMKILGARELIRELRIDLGKAHVRNSNLDDECRRLAFATADQLVAIQRSMETRAVAFRLQHQSTPHRDHLERMRGYQETAQTIEQIIKEMKGRGEGSQPLRIDLG